MHGDCQNYECAIVKLICTLMKRTVGQLCFSPLPLIVDLYNISMIQPFKRNDKKINHVVKEICSGQEYKTRTVKLQVQH